MSELNKIEKYQLFCLEMYKIKRNLTGKVALKEFERYDVFSFISAGYEVLHTQSLDYAISQIIEYIEERVK